MKMDVFPPNTKYSTQTQVGMPKSATDKRSHLQKILIADRELSLCDRKGLPEKHTAIDRGDACAEINNNTVFDALGSPISIRTDLSLDEASVFSPSVIPISIDCLNDNSLSPTTSDQIISSPRQCLNSSIADSNVTCTFVELSPLMNSTGNQPQSENVEPASLVNSTESQTQSENVFLSQSRGIQTQTNTDLTETDCIVSGTLATSLHILNNNTAHIDKIAQVQSVSNSANSQLLMNMDSRPSSNINSVGTDYTYVDKRNHPVASYPIVNARGKCSSITKHHSNGFSKLPAPHSTGNGSPIFKNTDAETEVPKPRRRRKRRQPDLSEPPLPPALTVLPPCEVCGHKSSGFHYGANTCEACKGFFRRTLKKNEVTFQCVCSEEERREFQQEKRVGKNMCPACRYQQCLAIGMSRNAIKIGRYSIQKKTENICQVKTLEEDRNTTERYSLIPNTHATRTTKYALSSENKGVNSPSSSSENSAILNLYLSNDQTDTGSPSGDSEYGFTGRKSRSTGELTLKEIDTYVKTLYHAHKSLLVKSNTFIQVDQLKRHQREYFEQYQLKRQLFGTMGYVSKEEYFELYNSTGIEIDNRKEMVQEATNYFEEKIAKLVEFAKCIPGFRELPLQDQANLIKGSRIDCGLLGLLHHPFNPDNNVTTTPWGRNVHIDEVGRILSKDLLFAKFRIRCMVEKLDLSPEEEAVLTAVLVTFTDRCELIDAEKVQTIQYKLVTCLEYLIKIRPTNQPNKFWRVFSFLMAMRNVSEWEAEMIQQISLDWPTIAMNPEKLESCVIGGLRQSM